MPWDVLIVLLVFVSYLPSLKSDLSKVPVEEEIIVPGFSSATGYDYDTPLQWNGGTFEQALQFQIEHCSYYQSCGKKGSKREQCPTGRCAVCSCDFPSCHIYGICCPDAHYNYANGTSDDGYSSKQRLKGDPDDGDEILAAQKNKGTESIELRQNDKSVCIDRELVVRHCPGIIEGNQDMRTSCVKDPSPGAVTLKQYVRVTDKKTNVTYYNIYCAECNDVEQVVSWDVRVECNNYQRVYQAADEDEFLQLSLRNDSSCTVLQNKPNGLQNGPRCEEKWFTDVTTTCNETHLWETFDGQVESLCKSISGYQHRVHLNDKTYSNLFCLICNSPPLNKYSMCEFQVFYSAPVRSYLPLSMLLGRPSRTDTEDQVLQVEEENLQCSPGKVYQNKSCVTALEKIRGLAYRSMLVLNLSITTTSDPFKIDINHPWRFLSQFESIFTEIIEKQLGQYHTNRFMTYGLAYNLQNQMPNTTNEETKLDQYLFLDLGILTSPDYPRDEVENVLVDFLYFENFTLDVIGFETQIEQIVVDTKTDVMDGCCCTERESIQYECITSVRSNILYKPTNILTTEYIRVSPMLTCPFIEFNEDSFTLERKIMFPYSITKASITYKGVVLKAVDEFDDIRQVEEDEGKLRVCFELMKKLIKRSQEQLIKPTNIWYVRYYLTVVALSLSIVSLLFTVVTYTAFSALRSSAGVNTMLLSVTLLVAQVMLLVTSHMVHEKGPLCTILGICTHLAWLSVFCWSFTCCFHMFRTFTAATRSIASGNDSFIRMLRRVAFCLAAPIIVVSCVMIASSTMSTGRTIGYGHVRCYLDSWSLSIITISVPLGLMVLSNFVFFAISVHKINKIRRLQSAFVASLDNRKEILVYVKLSSLTGCFWFFALLGESIDNNPLLVISDILNGLQGVFIFVSYICNKRVLNMYLQAFGLKDVPEQSSGTVTRLAKEIEGAKAE